MRFVRVGTGSMPTELLTYVLCSEVYHCLPSELERERVMDVMPHLTVHGTLLKWRNRKGR